MTVSALLRSRRPVGVVLTGVAATALVAGCAGSNTSSGQAAAGSSGESTSSASSSSSSAPASSSAADSSSGARQSPLSKGLLPASAFGSQANVVSLTLQQLQKATGGQVGSTDGLTFDPPQCAQALQSTQPDTQQVKDLVAQSATSQDTVTVEAILSGDATKGSVDHLKSTLTDCSKVTVTGPQLGKATITFSPVDVSGVGGPAAAVQYTTTVTPPGQPEVTVPAIVGVAQDGDRAVLLLTATAPPGANGGAAPAPAAPDPAAFTALLQKAYQTQHDALG